MFDKDNSEKLFIQEIINVFDDILVISQIDLNQDGEADFNEF